MFIVGLTGGIGSGKSAAAEYFIEHGVKVVNADHIAREVVAPGTPALDAIVERYGLDVLQSDGSLDRAALRKHVFTHDEERRWLEQLTHPLVAEITRTRLAAPAHEDEAPYRILESPLLLEVSRSGEVDRVLLVDAPRELQLLRVMARDASSEAQTNKIIDSQMLRDEKLALADDVLSNHGTLDELAAAVEQWHQRYCAMAHAKREREQATGKQAGHGNLDRESPTP